jgi:hypothetical protein
VPQCPEKLAKLWDFWRSSDGSDLIKFHDQTEYPLVI